MDPALAPERASVQVSFRLGNVPPISKTAQLLGPGDIVGINQRAIVKTEPRNWVTDFEANYLPYIEFYEEDFPVAFHACQSRQYDCKRANSARGSF